MTDFPNEKMSYIPKKTIFLIKHQIKNFLYLSEKLIFYTCTKNFKAF